MCRVVLLDQTQYVNHHLGAGLPSIPGRGITAPPDEVTRPTSVHIAVVQQPLNQIALATAKVLQWRWRRRKNAPNYRGGACVSESFFDRVTQGLRGDLEHERDRRLQLADTVSKHRAEFAFAQLENERALTSLCEELRVSPVDIDRSRAEITALQTLVDAHHREHKALCEMLERKGVLHRKKQRTDGTA
uniref:Uncharacterized protein n=1 Tax=Peronospora matthiolae TaxID=2874970 RepID=A0AAV1UR19_9STRA